MLHLTLVLVPQVGALCYCYAKWHIDVHNYQKQTIYCTHELKEDSLL